jgi:pyridoxal phosphate enzyme (YggS family)
VNEPATDGSAVATSIAARLDEVRSRVAQAALRAGRDPGTVTLVAVSKGRPRTEILAAYQAGQRDFGENRAAELAEKAPQLPSDIRWHFVGTLQRRKARLVRPIVVLLHSLDRPSLAAEWAKGTDHSPQVLLQVNVSGEVQKHGFRPDDVAEQVNAAAARGLDVTGLMTMPPIPAVPDDSRPFFAELRSLRDAIATVDEPLVELSMGMTDDFEVGVEEGATLIRVGRAIFGPVAS